MGSWPWLKRALAILPVLITGCAGYAARPVTQSGIAERYHARRLSDPAVRAAFDSLGIAPPAAAWQDWELATAAWVLRPERGRLLAEIRAADASRISAGARPRPGIGTETEYSFSGSNREPRFGLALSSIFAVELGGKRGARIAQANARALAVRARADEEGWYVRWQVREAVADQEQAGAVWERGRAELALMDTVFLLAEMRYSEGAMPRSEVARMEADRQERAAMVAADQRVFAEARSALASATGVPEMELARTSLVADSTELCQRPLTRDSLELVALGARRELRSALAEYQIAEADLRGEVANSWPDIALGPGLFFDHGVNKWTVAFGLPALPLNRNRGPIAEAAERREVAAHRVAESQELVLGEVDQAIAACAAAMEEASVLSASGAEERATVVEGAYRRGEVGRLEVALARLELLRATRRNLEVAGRRRRAGLELERAVGTWTGSPVILDFEREGL